jgi:hypothetical protein
VGDYSYLECDTAKRRWYSGKMKNVLILAYTVHLYNTRSLRSLLYLRCDCRQGYLTTLKPSLSTSAFQSTMQVHLIYKVRPMQQWPLFPVVCATEVSLFTVNEESLDPPPS